MFISTAPHFPGTILWIRSTPLKGGKKPTEDKRIRHKDFPGQFELSKGIWYSDQYNTEANIWIGVLLSNNNNEIINVPEQNRWTELELCA